MTAAVLLALVAVGLAAYLSEDNVAHSADIPPSPVALAQYEIFSRPATTADARPESEGRIEGGPAADGIARRMSVGDPSVALWATLSGSRVCVLKQLQGGGSESTCAPVSALDHDITTGSLLVLAAGEENSTSPGPVVSLAGLAPNGLSSVTAHFADGSSQTIPVREDGFYVSLTKPETVLSFSWTDSAGNNQSQVVS